jgi:LuxR family maltose regulon positive regulatory protein
MSFPRTKIQPPQSRQGGWLPRPALARRLRDALLTRPLVLVCAAAGYGKTTALAQQAAGLPAGTALAWVACDEGDGLGPLLECLVAALEPHDPPWRSAPESLVRAAAEAATPAQRRAVAAELINALDACEAVHGVIVLDDLHRVDEPAVFAFLDALLERMTPRWTLALSSRHEPPLALARLRARGELAEFRVDELRFAADEARDFGAAAGLGADAADALFERAQGWPAGLRLALSSRRAGGPAFDGHAFEFLASEVTARLPAPLRDFLLATSVLPEITAARGAALSGDAAASQRLSEIERAGLFATVLDADEPTLRLHDLFRGALEAQLAREQPERLCELLRRAAATEPDAARRVAWLQRAGDWAAAEQALSESAEGLMAGGAAASVRALFERFPADWRAASPLLQMLMARARWDWDTAITATRRAAEAYAAAGRHAERSAALSHLAVALAGANRHAEAAPLLHELLNSPAPDPEALPRTLGAAAWLAARDDQREVAPLWSRLLEALQRSPQLARWAECAPLAPLVGLPGMRPLLLRYLDGAARRWPEHATPLRAGCHVVQGWLHLFAGELDAARAAADVASADVRWLARPVSVDAPSRSLQAVLAALRGDHGAIVALRQQVADIEGSGMALRVEVYRPLYLCLAMRVAALLDDRDTLAEMAGRLAAEPADSRSWLSPAQRAGAHAHLAALAGREDEALQRWQAMVDDPAHGDLYGQLVDARLRLADALAWRGRHGAAAAVLADWQAQAQASGEWGSALLAGPALLQRLAGLDWRGLLDPAPAALLARCAAVSVAAAAAASGAAGTTAATAATAAAAAAAATAGASPAAVPMPAAGAAVTLSPREQEVLARIAAGDSNKLIARAFDLSPHTVKRHVANILDKLALATRGQAAAWWRAHGPPS